MSAFMVNEETMDAVVTSIIQHCTKFADEVSSKPTRIGRKLFMMNRRALLARYGRSEKLPEYTFTERKDLSEAVRWVSIQCLLYQCTEGNVPNSVLYQELKAVSDCIKEQYGFDWKQPEIANAPWGF